MRRKDGLIQDDVEHGGTINKNWKLIKKTSVILKEDV